MGLWMLLYRKDFLQSSYNHKQGVSKTGVAMPKGRGRGPEETPPLKQRETERVETPIQAGWGRARAGVTPPRQGRARGKGAS